MSTFFFIFLSLFTSIIPVFFVGLLRDNTEDTSMDAESRMSYDLMTGWMFIAVYVITFVAQVYWILNG